MITSPLLLEPMRDTKRLHVAIIDEELPYPLNSGKRIRTYNLVSRLARRHHIGYIYHRGENASESAQAEEHFRSLGIDTVAVPYRFPRKSGLEFYGRLLANLASPLPYSVQIHHSREMMEVIRSYELAYRPDVWHCEWTPYAENLRVLDDGRGGPTGLPDHQRPSNQVVVAHNVESLIWQRYCENETNPLKRWYIRQQWRKFERFERRILGNISHVIAVSDSDSRIAHSRFGATHVAVVDNGVDVDFFHPNADVSRKKIILMLGSLDWRPNLDAAELLLTRIFPAVLLRDSTARLQLVGRRPPSWLAELVRETPNAELHADVPDVRPFLWQCGALAVPLRIGGGSRLKIIEALSCQCPVVSTRVGAEGLALTPGEHFVEVSEVAQMATALVALLREPARSRKIAAAGCRQVRSLYNWDGLADKLEGVWHDCATTTAETATPGSLK
jgi:glycosyltransferase involved in cell wall biosynthesis